MALAFHLYAIFHGSGNLKFPLRLNSMTLLSANRWVLPACPSPPEYSRAGERLGRAGTNHSGRCGPPPEGL